MIYIDVYFFCKWLISFPKGPTDSFNQESENTLHLMEAKHDVSDVLSNIFINKFPVYETYKSWQH